MPLSHDTYVSPPVRTHASAVRHKQASAARLFRAYVCIFVMRLCALSMSVGASLGAAFAPGNPRADGACQPDSFDTA